MLVLRGTLNPARCGAELDIIDRSSRFVGGAFGHGTVFAYMRPWKWGVEGKGAVVEIGIQSSKDGRLSPSPSLLSFDRRLPMY